MSASAAKQPLHVITADWFSQRQNTKKSNKSSFINLFLVLLSQIKMAKLWSIIVQPLPNRFGWNLKSTLGKICTIKCIRKIPNRIHWSRTLELQSSYVTFTKINGCSPKSTVGGLSAVYSLPIQNPSQASSSSLPIPFIFPLQLQEMIRCSIKKTHHTTSRWELLCG